MINFESYDDPQQVQYEVLIMIFHFYVMEFQLPGNILHHLTLCWNLVAGVV